jgi:hypothetical protein
MNIMNCNTMIAMLSYDIREELNLRLLHGRQAKELVPWLNKLPKVKEMLAEKFDGKPILEKNVSHWKNGGFVEWKHSHDVQNTVSLMLGNFPAMVAAVQSGLVDQMAVLLAAHMLAELKRLPPATSSEEKTRLWLELRISMAAMKRYELYTERLKQQNLTARDSSQQEAGESGRSMEGLTKAD